MELICERENKTIAINNQEIGKILDSLLEKVLQEHHYPSDGIGILIQKYKQLSNSFDNNITKTKENINHSNEKIKELERKISNEKEKIFQYQKLNESMEKDKQCMIDETKQKLFEIIVNNEMNAEQKKTV